MFDLIDFRVVNWPRPARYVYFLASNLKFKSYPEWCNSGEPNPFVRSPRRKRQTNEREIADIFEMTSQELSAFGHAEAGGVPLPKEMVPQKEQRP